MPSRVSKSGSEVFIVDNSDVDWKVLRYLYGWCQTSNAIDVATGYFEIGALLALKDEWQKDRVAPGRCRPGAPTDPYVLTLEHTVPQIRVSLRVDRATEPYALEPMGNDRRCH